MVWLAKFGVTLSLVPEESLPASGALAFDRRSRNSSDGRVSVKSYYCRLKESYDRRWRTVVEHGRGGRTEFQIDSVFLQVLTLLVDRIACYLR